MFISSGSTQIVPDQRFSIRHDATTSSYTLQVRSYYDSKHFVQKIYWKTWIIGHKCSVTLQVLILDVCVVKYLLSYSSDGNGTFHSCGSSTQDGLCCVWHRMPASSKGLKGSYRKYTSHSFVIMNSGNKTAGDRRRCLSMQSHPFSGKFHFSFCVHWKHHKEMPRRISRKPLSCNSSSEYLKSTGIAAEIVPFSFVYFTRRRLVGSFNRSIVIFTTHRHNLHRIATSFADECVTFWRNLLI